MNASRQSELLAAADLLLDARRTGVAIADLPENLRPTNNEEIDAIQDAIAAGFGPIGGWKIGAPSLEATPSFAPMPAEWIAPSGSLLGGPRHYRGLEAEIAFLVGEDLPPRATPYTRAEVLAAMASCHPVIEVLETAIADPNAADPKTPLADLQRNGGFIYGAAFDWHNTNFDTEEVTLAVDGAVRRECVGSNTSGISSACSRSSPTKAPPAPAVSVEANGSRPAPGPATNSLPPAPPYKSYSPPQAASRCVSHSRKGTRNDTPSRRRNPRHHRRPLQLRPHSRSSRLRRRSPARIQPAPQRTPRRPRSPSDSYRRWRAPRLPLRNHRHPRRHVDRSIAARRSPRPPCRNHRPHRSQDDHQCPQLRGQSVHGRLRRLHHTHVGKPSRWPTQSSRRRPPHHHLHRSTTQKAYTLKENPAVLFVRAARLAS